MTDDEKIVQELGPMPPEGSRIFMGYTFLLTITDVSVGHRHEPVTDSERNNTDVEEHHGKAFVEHLCITSYLK